jgi:oxazoline/thiazoline dehydrogenase
VRRHGDVPITVSQLGEFLYRVARAHPAHPGEVALPPRARTRRRVYPGGGACHPLEFYVLVARCEGLEEGAYHYDPAGHSLERLPDPDDIGASLLRTGVVPMEGGATPQLLIVLGARFRRLSWKYEGNAYALLLQEVGVLYQSMYLVATAMELAPCAVGGGDAARFAALLGCDPLEEASVGAFVLGSVAR